MIYSPASLLTLPTRGTERRWVAALARYGADQPAIIAGLYFHNAPLVGLNADLALAQAVHETGWFTSRRWLEQRNPAGIGITDSSVEGVEFSSPEVGIRAHLAHLCCYVYPADTCPVVGLRWYDPRHSFHDSRPALADLIRPERSWAVPGTGYAEAVARIANDVIGEGAPIVALAAGHHNSQSGNPLEIRLVGELIGPYAAAFRAAGFVTRVITPESGPIAAVARRAVDLGADLLIELHTEAGPRGVFVIYPDWPDAEDIDVDARDMLGPALAGAISQASGLPVRASGPVMSERLTSVGAQGFRLALFAASVGAKASMTRLLIEHGAHTQPADLALLEQAAVREAIAGAAARVCAGFYGLVPPVDTNPLLDAEYERMGGMAALGMVRMKARLAWTTDWVVFDNDILVCARGVVSISPEQTDIAQRLFVDAAATSLEAAGKLRPYGI